jgi:streptogramin lyase
MMPIEPPRSQTETRGRSALRKATHANRRRCRRRLTVETLESRSLLTSVSWFAIPLSINNDDIRALTAGSDGNVWFASDGEIAMMNPKTGAVSQFTLPGGASAVGTTTGPDGNIWFAGFTGLGALPFPGSTINSGATSGVIGMINVTTHAITEFPDMMSNTYANQITTGPDGNLWFTNAGTNDIGIFDPTTSAFTEVLVPGPGPYYSAGAITTGPDGNIWAVMGGNPGNTIARIDATTHAVTAFSVPMAPGPTIGLVGDSLGGITAGPDGNIWFTELGVNDGQIGMINLATDVITQVPAPLAGEGITAGPDGDVWFISWTGSSIGMLDPTTDDITMFPTPVPIPSPIGAILTVGSDGNLWFAAPGNALIGDIDPTDLSGEVTDPVGPVTDPRGSQTDPVGSATGPVGSAIIPASSGQFGFALSVGGASSGAGVNATVTLALAAGPGGDTLTVSTAQGVITDSSLTLKKERGVYKLVSSTAGTRALGTTAASRWPILTERVLTGGKGRDKHAIGIEVRFRKALDPLLATDITSRSKARSTESAVQPAGVRVNYTSALGGASLELSGKAKFTPDGQIIVVAKPDAG